MKTIVSILIASHGLIHLFHLASIKELTQLISKIPDYLFYIKLIYAIPFSTISSISILSDHNTR
jgi:hypothetical protein